jgi:hypothetical protein
MDIGQLVSTEPEVYSSHVTRQWVVGYPIVMIKICDVTRPSVDEWFQVCKKTMEELEGDSLFALHDMTSDGMGLTPYAQAKAGELLKLHPELKVYTALLLQKTLIAQLISLFLRKNFRTHHVIKIFFKREAALEWLIEEMTQSRRR